MNAVERILSYCHFVEENKTADEVELIYNPNDDVVIKVGSDYVEQIALLIEAFLNSFKSSSSFRSFALIMLNGMSMMRSKVLCLMFFER